MITVLIHYDLKNVWLYYFHYLKLHLFLIGSVLDYLLYDSAPIAMETNKQEFSFGHFINKVFVLFCANLNELLDHIVSKLIVDEVIDLGVKILEYLIFEELVG